MSQRASVRLTKCQRRSQHVRAEDLAGVDRAGDGRGIRSAVVAHPHGEAPLRGQELLRLHRDEPLARPRAHCRALGARSPCTRRRSARRASRSTGYETSRRHVVAPPMTVATTAMPSSTSPPCHHSRLADEPVDMML